MCDLYMAVDVGTGLMVHIMIDGPGHHVFLIVNSPPTCYVVRMGNAPELEKFSPRCAFMGL